MTTPDETERRLIDAALDDIGDAVAGGRPPTPRPDPDAFAGYTILGEIHRGGQGVVYEATQERTGRRVAIKVLREGPGEHGRARFEREVRILAQLRHPNIVTIHDSGTAGPWSFFVMDYIDGRPLDAWLEAEEHTIREVLVLFTRIALAVADAHLHGVIHRDLKPSNVMVGDDGEPHILDFGLAKLTEEEDGGAAMTVTGHFVGSLPWASPEQAEGAPGRIDLRTDVYSLGVILYEMLTGRFPYEVVGTMRQVMDNILRAAPTRPSTIRGQINDELETIVLKCLAKEPPRRYQSAGELARDLERLRAGEPIEAKRDSVLYLVRKAIARRRWQVAAVVAAVLAIGTLLVVMDRNRRMATEREQARIAELVRTPWRGNDAIGDDRQAQLEALYRDFLARLVVGETTPAERELYLDNLLDIQVQTPDILGLHDGFAAQLDILPRQPAVDAHGVWVWLRQTYRLEGVEVLSFAGTLRLDSTLYFWEKGPVDVAALMPRLAPGSRVELEAETEVHFTNAPYPGQFVPPPAAPPAPSLGTTHHRVTRSLLVLSESPYPVAVTDRAVAARIEAGFAIRAITIDGPSRIAVSYRHPSDVPVIGRLEIVDPASGRVVGESTFSALQASPAFALNSTACTWHDPTFPARARDEGLEQVAVRITPSRDSAVKVGRLSSYYGLPIERAVPLQWR